MLTRRGFLGAVALAVPVRAASPDITFAQDFDELWQTIGEHYCYFADKATDWDRVRAVYRPQAVAATSESAFATILARVLGELYDAHTHLNAPADGSPRWPPYDLLVDGDACIVAVQDGSAAAAAGLHAGDRVVAVDRRPLADVAAGLSPQCLARPDPAAARYVLNVVVAGRRGLPRRFSIVTAGTLREVVLPLVQHPDLPDVSWRRLADGTGVITIRSFADQASIAAFDTALAALREAPALIIDVRGNGGGDTAVARPMMGRFITTPQIYATMRRREGAGLSAPWTEIVEPRGPFAYTAPVAVVADHWSGSMAEGFPMGMRAIRAAPIVGTRMMGLGAAVFSLRLDRTGIVAQYSAEPVYDPAGRPRSSMAPDVVVAPGGDDIAAAAARLAAPVSRRG